MSKLIVEGNEIDATPEVLLAWAMGVITGSFSTVGGIYAYQQMGNPGFGQNMFIDSIQRIMVQMEENDQIVDDYRIQNLIDAILPCLRQFFISSSVFFEWHEEHITDEMLKAHEEKISQTGSFYLPEWTTTPEYQECLQTSSDAYTAYLDGLEVAIGIIKEYYSQYGFDRYFDQLKRVEGQIPDARLMVEWGFAEAVKRKAHQNGDLPSA